MRQAFDLALFFLFALNLVDAAGCGLSPVALDQAQVFSLGFYIFERAEGFDCVLRTSFMILFRARVWQRRRPCFPAEQMREDGLFGAGNRFCEEALDS